MPQLLWIVADVELPFAEFSPIIDSRNPPLRTLVFGKDLFRFKTFDFQKEMNSVRESDDEIGFVSVRNTGVFIRNAQPKMVIPDIALYIFSVL